MENNVVESMALGGNAPVHDLSLWGLFMSADFIVKAVIIGLLGASFWSWTIIFNKVMRLKKLRHDAALFEDAFWSGGALDAMYQRVQSKANSDPMCAIFVAAMSEWKRSSQAKARFVRDSLQQRVERAMQLVLEREVSDIEKNMGFLASVGSTAPFIGLFGTVWGIMNSFQSIAASKNTSLAVVAPGIAEALFATALGLIAAIPAVLAYNKLSLEINRYASRLDTFAAEFMAIFSRQLDEEAA